MKQVGGVVNQNTNDAEIQQRARALYDSLQGYTVSQRQDIVKKAYGIFIEA